MLPAPCSQLQPCWHRCHSRLLLLRANAPFSTIRASFSVLQAPRSLLFMLLDFEVQRCTRCCAATERALEPGDECYSVLEVQGADVIRKDFSREAWKGAPETAFGWWKSRVPETSAKKI